MEGSRTLNPLFCLLSIFVAGSILFLYGFFPGSNDLTADHAYKNEQLTLLDIKLPKPKVKHEQVILLLIDAWRSNFVQATNMPYTTANACANLTIKVETPTVTMPRLKSITTGTISNFIDILLNLGHVAKLEDSLLHRMQAKDKRTVFAGDHTWIQLFPSAFERHKANTDSFFVNDFYGGDQNITDTLKKELLMTDWHLMVLHYLGLDHIGHVEGSFSHRIYQKLHEMDNVIEYINKASTFQNQILLVTGDHGMRNEGSHGGNEREELYVPLVVFSRKCVRQKTPTDMEYNQIDLTPTLAALLDIDIPHSSIGSLIPELLSFYDKEEQLYFYYKNSLHLVEKFRKKFPLIEFQQQGNADYYFWLTEAEMEHKHFISTNGTSVLSFEKAKQNYIRVCNFISKRLSESLVKFDNDLIFIALALTTLTALTLLLIVLFELGESAKLLLAVSSQRIVASLCLALLINGLAHYMHLIKKRHIIYSSLLTIPIAISICLAINIAQTLYQIAKPLTYQRKSHINLAVPWVLLAFLLMHTCSMGSSSLIEEEHQSWYYLTPTMLVFLCMQNFYRTTKKVWKEEDALSIVWTQMWQLRFIAMAFIGIIFCRRLNQTGNKWRHLVDIGDILGGQQNYKYLALLFGIALLFLFWMLRKHNSRQQMLTCFLALLCVFLYRITDVYRSVVLVVFWLSVLVTGVTYYRNTFCKTKKYGEESKGYLVEILRSNMTCCLLVSALLHRPHNVILLPMLVYTLEKSYELCDNLHMKDKRLYNRCYVLVLKTVITIFIANMFYFFQGNSNSLSTIDLNPGYIGLSSYNPFIVGPLITLNTYCAPINAYLYLICHMFATQKSSLPMRQEKEQITNLQLLESTTADLYLVIGLFTATTVMPVAVYWLLLLGFRYHLFIYSVFAPKAIYNCFHIIVYYLNFIVTNLYFKLFD